MTIGQCVLNEDPYRFRVLSPVNSLKIFADADQMFDDTRGWDYSYK